MEEKEIIQILKDNKVEARPYCWMPRDVRIWIDGHYKECAYLNKHGAWDKSLKYINHSSDITMTDIFCLLESCIQPRSGGEWVEFEINEYGVFPLPDMPDTYLAWWDWGMFLKNSSANGWGFTAFGGWKYEASDIWFMYPVIFGEGDAVYHSIYADKDEPRPVIPKKIRFWRK